MRLCWGWGPCGRGCWVSLGDWEAVVLVKGKGSKELDILCFFLAFPLEGQVQA